MKEEYWLNLLSVMSDAELIEFINQHQDAATQALRELTARHADLPQDQFDCFVGIHR